MNDTTTGPPGVETAEELHKRMMADFRDVLRELEEYKSDLRKLRDELAKDADPSSDTVKRLRKITDVIASARNSGDKAYDFANERAGPAGQFAIDLFEARSEIGRRLDRLRRACGAERISGQS